MADIWFDVDSALSEVPINIVPLLDDTDFKSREESVTYNQAGLDLVWNFVTTAGAMTQTAVTPTDTGGNYDWVNQGNGMYSIEIPASGGASINNDTEGFGWFTGFATGILPWRGPVIGFRAAGINNVLIDSAYSTTRGLAGTALPDAAADAAGGLPISDAGGLDLDAQIGTDIDAILADTNELQTDDTPGALSTLSGKVDTIDDFLDTEVAAILEDTATTIPATLASILEDTGTTLDALIKDIPTNTELATALGTADDATLAAIAGLDTKIDTIDNFLDTEVAAILEDTSTTLPATLASILEDTGTTIPATLTTIDNFLDTEVAAILADTNELQTDWANGGRLDLILDAAGSAGDPWATELPGAYGAGTAGKIVGDNINAPLDTIDTVVDAILADTGTTGVPLTAAAVDAILDEVVEGSYTLRHYMRLFASALLGKVSGGGGTTITFRDTGDTKNRIVATVDTSGNRTALTLTEG